MIPQTLIQDATRDGLTLAPTGTGTLRVHGPKAAIAKWAPILKERKAEVLAALAAKDARPIPSPNKTASHWRLPDGRPLWVSPPETAEQVQARYPGAVPWVDETVTVTPLNKAERSHILAWLAFIGEKDPRTIADVLATCERYPDTRAHCLREARNAGARRIIAARVAKEASEERAGILEHEAGLARTEAERVSKLAEAFYNHLWGPGMASNCCHGRTGKYCAEGRKLRDAYYEAAKSAGKLA